MIEIFGRLVALVVNGPVTVEEVEREVVTADQGPQGSKGSEPRRLSTAAATTRVVVVVVGGRGRGRETEFEAQAQDQDQTLQSPSLVHHH